VTRKLSAVSFRTFSLRHFTQNTGTNGSSIHSILASVFRGGTGFGIIPNGCQNIGTKQVEVLPLSEGKPSLQHKIWSQCPSDYRVSKTYDDSFNPQSAFAAILTCSQADGACPFIASAENASRSLLRKSV
jgi:arsenate reductase